MEYFINLSNGWSIENKDNIDKEVKLINLEHDVPFGQFECGTNGINWIYDAFAPSDEDIQHCKAIDPFLKNALFLVHKIKDEGWVKVDEFEGTFIDALTYIKNNYDEF